MGARIEFYRDPIGQTMWKTVQARTITYHKDIAFTISSLQYEDKTIKYGNGYIEDCLFDPTDSGSNILVNYRDSYNPNEWLQRYTKNGLFTFQTYASFDGINCYAGVRWFGFGTTTLYGGELYFYGTDYMNAHISMAQLEINGEEFMAFYFILGSGTVGSTLSAFVISLNAFEGSFQPRYVPSTIPDSDGGYGTGDTPSGNQDGSVINVDVGGDTVNVAPPNVSVNVEVNMPEPEKIEISHPTGITIAKITEAQLAYLTDALWGRDVTGFNNLWKQFENYKFNPIAGIVACHRLPSWTFVGGYDSAAAIVIAGTTIPNFNGRKPASNFAVKTFTTAPITQFNTYEDFVGVTVRAYAPFVGWFDLDPSLCFGVSTNESMCCIEFQYQVDKLNGNIGLTIMGYTVGKSDTQSHKIPLATGIGNCAYPVYITGNDQGAGDILGGFKQVIGGAASIAAGVVTENIPLTAGGISSMSTGLLNAATATHHTTSVGGCSGNAGYLSYLIPFVQVIKPRYVRPSQFANIYGRPSYAHGKVSDFEGMYAELDVHCSSFGFANEQEQKKIIDMLARGVHV